MAGALLVSGFSLPAMISRAFWRDLPRCGDRAHCKNKKLVIIATFFAIADSSLLLKA